MGAAVAQEVEGVVHWPWSGWPDPQLLQDATVQVTEPQFPPGGCTDTVWMVTELQYTVPLCECVCEWVNVACTVKHI